MRFLPLPLLMLMLSTLAAQAPAPSTPQASAQSAFRTLDDGQLQNAWFGADLDWKEHAKGFLDFFWMKPGLNLAGHTLDLKKWEPPTMLIPGRDSSSQAMAVELGTIARGDMEARFEHLLDGKAKVSFYDGDLLLIGRVVDCRYLEAHTGTLGMGREAKTVGPGLYETVCSATFDLKVVDKKTNELLLATHHRFASPHHDVDMMMRHWVPDFGRYLAKVAVH